MEIAFWILLLVSSLGEGVLPGACKSETEVLVLGAGIAGVSAAKTLSDGGIKNFLILEAEDRIGGRVKNTVLQSGVRVELGANWIQGIDPGQPEKHPLWRIVQACGGVGGRYSETFSNGTMHVFDEEGKNITESLELRNRLAQWNKILYPGLPSYAQEREESGLPDLSARQALVNTGWIPNSSLDDMIEWNGFDLDEYATTPERVSLYGNFPDQTYTDFGNPDKTINYFVTDQEEGFVKVVRCLAQDFLKEDDPRLHLGSTVMEVDWSDSKGVCVNTIEKGTVHKYCAPHAILTFSLGVLKSGNIKFKPDLPAPKKNAINVFDFVLYLKIFLEFEEIFWKKDAYVDSILCADSVRGNFVQFEPLTNSTPVIFTTVTGEVAKMVYNQSVEDTTAQIMEALRLIYGNEIPDPVSVTIPDWWVNPLFRGTYSNHPPGFSDAEMSALKAPVGGLHFGGEATNEAYTGYVHGGYYSGIEAAKEVMERK